MPFFGVSRYFDSKFEILLLCYFSRVYFLSMLFSTLFQLCLKLHLGFSLGTVGQHFGPWIEIGQTRVMIDIKASDAHSRV